jgi:hypothetical protein
MLLILRSTRRFCSSIFGSPDPAAAAPTEPRPPPDKAVPAEFVPGAVGLVPSEPPLALVPPADAPPAEPPVCPEAATTVKKLKMRISMTPMGNFLDR